MRLKYIIDDRNNFAIFSELATHRDVARGFNTHNQIVGAGFCYLNVQGHNDHVNVDCTGESISLGIESRPEDGKIITAKLNNETDY